MNPDSSNNANNLPVNINDKNPATFNTFQTINNNQFNNYYNNNVTNQSDDEVP